MGIYDREYYQEDRPGGFHAAGPSSMVTKLVVINVVLFFLNLLSENALFAAMAAEPQSLANPLRWWQLLSYGFAHSPSDIWHIAWNMFALWIFGRDVEAHYGPKEFLRIYLLTIFLGGLLFAARGLAMGATQPVIGASGAVTAIVLLFCVHYPKRTILLMFVFPVPAWVLGVMIIALNILGLAGGEQPVAYDVHLVGVAFAICYYKFGWNLGRWLPSFSGGSPRSKSPGGWLKRKPKLKIHDPEDRYRSLDEQADEVLKKVNRDGIDALSPKERRLLEDYSRRMQQKRR